MEQAEQIRKGRKSMIDKVFAILGASAFLVSGLYILFATINVQQMSDDEREIYGHGPKGQGRK